MAEFLHYYSIGFIIFFTIAFGWYVKSSRFFLDMSNNKFDKMWLNLFTSCFVAVFLTSLVYPVWYLLWVYSRSRNFVKSLINKYYKR